ncbi:MAG: HAMP domain-containing protein [Acidobacteriia bacterium]|nr:HAMP domain-containing protein [Terriglobia bacterium]
MKIRTQITLGYFGLVALMVAVAIYFMVEIRWLNRTNRDLSNIDFHARTEEQEQGRLLEDIFISDQKFLVTQDPDYLDRMINSEKQFTSSFEHLRRLLVSPEEQAKAQEIEKTYSEYNQVFNRRMGSEGAVSTEDLILLDNRKFDLTQSLKRQYSELEQSTVDVMQKRLLYSEGVRRRARQIAWIAGSFSIILAVGLSLFLARKISRPLLKLIAGTRLIATGKFRTLIHLNRRDEFGELAQAFNSMAKQLGELDELKRGFVSHVSHELRSPLASMLATNDLLLSEAIGSLNDKQKRLLTISREKSDMLSRRINDLLDLSRIEAGAMEYQLEPSDVSAILKSAIESASPLLREKNLCIVTECDMENSRATIDSRRIVQVVENLLSNAIKFSRENTTIRAGCHRTTGQQLAPVFNAWNGNDPASSLCDPQGEYMVISVEDKGIGIPPGETRRIFERFYQAGHGNEVSKTGTGLGLAICQSIIEAHNGVIWVESELGQGSRFQFALPTSLPQGVRKSSQIV